MMKTTTDYWNDRLATCSCGARASVRDVLDRRGRLILRDVVCTAHGCQNRKTITVESMREKYHG